MLGVSGAKVNMETKGVWQRVAHWSETCMIRQYSEARGYSRPGDGPGIVANMPIKFESMLIEEILTEIKEDTSNIPHIKQSTDKLVNLMESLLGGMKKVTSTYKHLQTQIEDQDVEIKNLKKEIKKNNLVIYNIPDEGENIVESVISTCRDAGIRIDRDSINYCKRVKGNGNSRPVLVSFTSNLVKQEIVRKKDMFARGCPEEQEELTSRRTHKILAKLRTLDSNAEARNHRIRFMDQWYNLEEAEEIIAEDSSDSEH